MFLHLLPSRSVTSYVRCENFPKSPNPNGILPPESYPKLITHLWLLTDFAVLTEDA